MVIQSYPDGTEFTGKHLAISIVAGAVIGTGLFVAKEKISDIRMSRYCKKHDIPWKNNK